MTKTLIEMLVGTGIAASTLLGLSAAQAQTASISYRPYELATAAGSRAVFERIQRSAKRACRWDIDTLRALEKVKCEADLTQQMVDKIGHPAVSALLTGKPGVQLASRGR